jgi:hypothetical protein
LVVGTVVSGGVVGSGSGGVVDSAAFLGSVGWIVSARGFGAMPIVTTLGPSGPVPLRARPGPLRGRRRHPPARRRGDAATAAAGRRSDRQSGAPAARPGRLGRRRGSWRCRALRRPRRPTTPSVWGGPPAPTSLDRTSESFRRLAPEPAYRDADPADHALRDSRSPSRSGSRNGAHDEKISNGNGTRIPGSTTSWLTMRRRAQREPQRRSERKPQRASSPAIFFRVQT